MRLAAQAKGGYYPTPERVVDLIAELIHTPTGYYHRGRETIRILDPCCGAGDALERLAERLDRPNALSIETYGVELHRDRAEEAEKRLHRTLASDLFATSIANGAFGLLLLNPPYDFDSEDKRTEHAFLTQTTRYLAESGLLVFIVPRQRLAVSARYLSTHYGRMRCWAFPDPEREVFDQVVLMGYRKADPVPDATAESMVLEWAVGEPEPLRSQRNSYSHPEYTPATTPSGDVLFTTRTVDPAAAAAEARRSGLWASTEITDSLWPASDSRTRPLMPLKRGHMAMLVAAGFLDNLVLEGDDRRILVKGRTSKEMVMVEDAPEKEVHREKLTTTVVALDLETDRSRTSPPRWLSPEAAPTRPRWFIRPAGPSLVWNDSEDPSYQGKEGDRMQKTMTLEACCRCGQPIAPGEPAMQTASVDIIGGRAVSSPVKTYHLSGRCYDEAKAEQAARREALKAA